MTHKTTQDEMSRRAGVAVRKSKYDDHRDDFPTPPWGTRALLKYVAPEILTMTPKPLVFEPACGAGHMVRALEEFKLRVRASDRIDYGWDHELIDYVEADSLGTYDLLITNPPYWLAQKFAERALNEAKIGVALLVRTLWLEGKGRFDRLFSPHPPTRIAIFTKRMPAAQGRVIRKGAMMSHSWFWWNLTQEARPTEMVWIPPAAQLVLEREEDYQ